MRTLTMVLVALACLAMASSVAHAQDYGRSGWDARAGGSRALFTELGPGSWPRLIWRESW